MVVDIGLPGMGPRCFVPPHRVIARDAHGQEFALTVLWVRAGGDLAGRRLRDTVLLAFVVASSFH